MTEQKGFDILTPVLPEILRLGAQVVLLGTGEKRFEDPLAALARESPGFVAALKYDEVLAHKIYAGSDFFLMPSRFEPCGLGQLYAMRYGSIPVVHAVGGLRDTVIDDATGVRFEAATPAALADALDRAIAIVRDPDDCDRVRTAGMARDSSWRASAQQYHQLYRSLLEVTSVLRDDSSG